MKRDTQLARDCYDNCIAFLTLRSRATHRRRTGGVTLRTDVIPQRGARPAGLRIVMSLPSTIVGRAT
jgi:hypothetical protein